MCSSGGRKALERVAADTAKKYGGYYTNYFANDDNPEYPPPCDRPADSESLRRFD